MTVPSNVVVVVTDEAGSILPDVPVQNYSDGSYHAVVSTAPGLSTGDHAGSIEVQMCSDQHCTTSYGSASLPYDFTVLPSQNLVPLSPLAGAADWETFQGSARHTGFVPATLDPSKFSVRRVWTNPDASVLTAPALEAGLVYLASPSKLYALSEADYSTRWSAPIASTQAVFDPAVSDGLVAMLAYDGSGSGALLGFEAATGASRFSTPLVMQYDPYGAPVIQNGTIYALTGYAPEPYTFDAGTGAIKSRPGGYDTAGQLTFSVPAVDAGGNFFYYTDDPDYGDDQTLWENDSAIGGDPAGVLPSGQRYYGPAHAVVLADASHLIFNTGAHLDSFNPDAGGAPAWTVSGAFISTPAVAGSTIYVQNESPYQLEARSVTDGHLLWSWTPPDTLYSGDVVATNNLVFFSTDQAVYAVDTTGHTQVWSYPGAGRLAISASGILYIQRNSNVPNGALVAVNLH